MQTIINLLSPSYLFHRNLSPFSPSFAWTFIGILVLLMVLSYFYFRLAKNRDVFMRKFSVKLVALSFTMGIIGILLVLVRQINVLYLSAPILLLFWLIVFIIWALVILNYRFRTVPKRKKDLMQESGQRNYIP
jgi:O-antigen/teichoic acid export membrane protein